jgi:hypothetical protein
MKKKENEVKTKEYLIVEHPSNIFGVEMRKKQGRAEKDQLTQLFHAKNTNIDHRIPVAVEEDAREELFLDQVFNKSGLFSEGLLMSMEE